MPIIVGSNITTSNTAYINMPANNTTWKSIGYVTDGICKFWRGPRSKIKCELPEKYPHDIHWARYRGKTYSWRTDG